ncbi:MAG TPA: VWA domain-containing protein [Acidimicrobiales bacterium]
MPETATPLRPERAAVAFCRVLRSADLEVPVDSVLAFVRAWEAVGADDRRLVYWAGRATLVRRPEDIGIYDVAFAAFFGGNQELGPGPPPLPSPPVPVPAASDDGGGDGQDDGDEDRPTQVVRWSPGEVLRHKDFAACTDAERTEAMRLLAQLRVRRARRRSRRRRPTSQPGRWPDLRRTTRAAMRAGGETMDRRWLDPGERPRRLVLLVDVSGSMEAHARALLRFAQVVVAGGTRVEAFAIGTRLTRLTRELSSRDPDASMRAASSAVVDWSGGTRLGACLREFNDQWGVRGLARGATVVVLSVGWDRGEPELLGAEVERLHRVTHRLVWVNPLKASPGYEPLARGMAAALPHVDLFLEGHSLASLEDLAEVISA